jgi:hypothetical protein
MHWIPNWRKRDGSILIYMILKVELFFYTETERTEKTWKSGAKSFLQESYIGSICHAFITGFSSFEKESKKSG